MRRVDKLLTRGSLPPGGRRRGWPADRPSGEGAFDTLFIVVAVVLVA
jgi:hypothetical protein